MSPIPASLPLQPESWQHLREKQRTYEGRIYAQNDSQRFSAQLGTSGRQASHGGGRKLRERSSGIVELSRPIVAVVSRKDRDLGSQLRRAISSIGLNIAEGLGNSAGNARLRFETALGSLRESVAALRIAVAWGYVAPSAVAQLIESLDSLGGRVFGLTKR